MTPIIQFTRDLSSTRDKSSPNKNGSTFNVKPPNLSVSSNAKQDEEQISKPPRISVRSSLEKVIPKDSNLKTDGALFPKAKTSPKLNPLSETSSIKYQPPVLNPSEQTNPEEKDQKVHYFDVENKNIESYKIMMQPPLIIFGGQNAVRLDPLLTRKSSGRSGK